MKTKKKTIRVGIVGAAGFGGQELLQALLRHPHALVTCLADQPGTGAEDALRHFGRLPVPVTAFGVDKCADTCDAVFLALPHEVSMEYAPALIEAGVKVLDLSAAFRLKDPELYDEYYGFNHHALGLLKSAAYGLPELYAAKIRKADLIAVPGCYPTSAILPLAPLLRKRLLKGRIIVDSKSGVTGAGRVPKAGLMFTDVNENFKAYALFTHRHGPEIAQELSCAAGKAVDTVFTPHLAPMNRGILTTSYSTLTKKTTKDQVLAVLNAFYAKSPFVRILEGLPETRAVRATNFCDVGAAVKGDCLILVSAVDNLGKGAARQAIQAFNVQHGLPETAGLEVPAGAP